VSQDRAVALKPGEALDLGTIRLERLAHVAASMSARPAARPASSLRSVQGTGRTGASPTAPAVQVAPAQPERSQGAAPRDRDGNVARFESIYSSVEGQVTVRFIVPDGAVVKKGDRICELDSAELRDRLINQRITTKSAEANFFNAKLTREFVETSLGEYERKVFPGELQDMEGEIKIAETELSLAQEELDAAKALGPGGKLAVKRAELDIFRARITMAKAQRRRQILVDDTKGRRLRELESDIKKARSDALAKQATWELEKGKEDRLEKQIANCTRVATIDGTVVLADTVRPDAVPGTLQLRRIAEGATVRERQLIMRIVPIPKADSETR
jgi:hypothetical protein